MSLYVDTPPTSRERSNIKEASEILGKIYEEDPWKWPNGLSIPHHDDLFLIRKEANDEAVGFVGWQERDKAEGKVGYYTIGVLPEYRGKHMAKQAVSRILEKKASGVDKVEALIAEGNEASERLADSLSLAKVILNKEAGWKGALGGGIGNAVFWDMALHPENKIKDTFDPSTYDKKRTLMAALNAGIGALGGGGMTSGLAQLANKQLPIAERTLGGAKIGAGAGLMIHTPGKDAIMAALNTSDKWGPMMDKYINSKEPGADVTPTWKKALLTAGVVGGVGALGYGGHRIAKSISNAANKAPSVKLRLPTKDPNDVETLIELPMEDIHLSQTMYDRLGRDTRRKLIRESKGREEVERKRRAKRKKIREMNEDAKEDEIVNMSKAAAAPPMGNTAPGTRGAPSSPQAGGQPVDPQMMNPSKTPWASNPVLASGNKATPDPAQAAAEEGQMNQVVSELQQKVDELSKEKGQSEPAAGNGPQPEQSDRIVRTAANTTDRVNRLLSRKGFSKSSYQLQKAPPAVTTGSLNRGYAVANKQFGDQKGFQVPLNLRPVLGGNKLLHGVGSAAHSFLNPAKPSGRAQFRPTTPTPAPWQALLGQFMGSIQGQ